MTTTTLAPAGTPSATASPSAFRLDLRAVSIVWRRELLRFRSDRLRMVSSLAQPVLFLFVLGTGLGSLARRGMPAGVDFRTYIDPGVLAMSVLFTSMFSAADSVSRMVRPV
jgi:ABC-2 type transport system permease protein